MNGKLRKRHHIFGFQHPTNRIQVDGLREKLQEDWRRVVSSQPAYQIPHKPPETCVNRIDRALHRSCHEFFFAHVTEYSQRMKRPCTSKWFSDSKQLLMLFSFLNNKHMYCKISPIDIIMVSIAVRTSLFVVMFTGANWWILLVFCNESDGLESSSNMWIIAKWLVFRKTTGTVFILFPRF